MRQRIDRGPRRLEASKPRACVAVAVACLSVRLAACRMAHQANAMHAVGCRRRWPAADNKDRMAGRARIVLCDASCRGRYARERRRADDNWNGVARHRHKRTWLAPWAHEEQLFHTQRLQARTRLRPPHHTRTCGAPRCLYSYSLQRALTTSIVSRLSLSSQLPSYAPTMSASKSLNIPMLWTVSYISVPSVPPSFNILSAPGGCSSRNAVKS